MRATTRSKLCCQGQSENQSRNNFATFIILALVCTGLNPLKLPALYAVEQGRRGLRASPASSRDLHCKLLNVCARCPQSCSVMQHKLQTQCVHCSVLSRAVRSSSLFPESPGCRRRARNSRQQVPCYFQETPPRPKFEGSNFEPSASDPDMCSHGRPLFNAVQENHLRAVSSTLSKFSEEIVTG